MNTFMNNLTEATDFHLTENGGLTHSEKTLKNDVYALFSFGGSYRQRSDEDVILLVKNAVEEDETLGMKCLFYLRDIRGGQGERRFFRVALNWLAKNHPELVKRNLDYISEYGRWDDLYCLFNTPLEEDMLNAIKRQLALDIQDLEKGKNGVSLLGKWLPSCNTSSYKTRTLGNKIRTYLNMTHKQYRKTLSVLRERIRIVEKLMSQNRWEEIDFSYVPSRAGLIYKNAFARRDIIAEKYKQFIESNDTKVHADALYPYDVVSQVVKNLHYNWSSTKEDRYELNMDDLDRKAVEKMWNNLPDYVGDSSERLLCVCDTSGSMTGSTPAAPINVAISLSMYAAERLNGPFHNKYISFSSRPQLIEISGIDFADKVKRIYETNLCENTDLEATFNLLYDACLRAKPEDRPTCITIISDMAIDSATTLGWNATKNKILTMMETQRAMWASAGMKLPRLVYWNVNARQNNVLDDGPDVTYVSGASASFFEMLLTGKTGWDLFMETVGNNKRYEAIHA